jgi:hypothetical protein
VINISPQFYLIFFTHLVLLIVIFTVFSFYSGDLRNKNYSRAALIFAFFLLLFIGLRPIDVPGVGKYFGDSINYLLTFNYIANGGNVESWSDPVFGFLTEFCAHNLSAETYFFILAALYIIPLYSACRRINGNRTFILLLGIVSSMLFLSGGVNGIRAGIGTSFVLLAFSYRDRKGLLAILFIFALGFHKSMFLPILAFLICSFYSNYKVYIFIWFISIGLSLAFGGFWENFFASFTIGDERFTNYLTTQVDASLFKYTGFRWDFLFYSFIPVMAGVYYITKLEYKNSNYIHLFNTYLIANSFWILVIRASYSNRFAALSWFLLPLILLVPLIEDNIFYNKPGTISIFLLLIFAFTYYAAFNVLWS